MNELPHVDRSRLEALLHRAAEGVRAAGLRAGQRVVTSPRNDVDAFALSWALTLEGVVEVPVPRSASADEATELVSVSRPDAALLLDDARPAGLAAAVAASGLPTGVLDLATGRGTAPGADAPRTRALAFTSGTTGRRKGVSVGVHDADWGAAWLADEAAAFDHLHGGRHLVVSPLYHSGPFRHALVTAHSGGTVQVLPRFDVELWLDTLRTFRPTSMFCVPTHLHRLVSHPATRPDDLASLQLLLHAGAPCPVPTKERVLELAPQDSVWEFYGSTEGQFTVCPPAVWQAAPGSVGHARPGRTVTVRDDGGTPLPPGAVGTVWGSAPWHARWRYDADGAATDAAWEGDTFTVGDLGRLDGDGRLTLTGRPGDLVITGGVNVYPAEVERALLTLPGVGEAAAFGVDDDEWGQRLLAAVVPQPGATVDGDALREALRSHLSPARVPRRVLVVDDLPRTPTGKVRRTDLPRLAST